MELVNMTAGRPTLYSEEIVNEILKQITEGAGLVRICKAGNMPEVSTVYRWLQSDEKFFNRYTRARDEQADTLADEICEIADTEKDANKARVRVDARKWVASKLKPKKYGDKQEIDVTDSRLVKAILEALPVEMAEQVRTAITERSGGQRKLAVVSGK